MNLIKYLFLLNLILYTAYVDSETSLNFGNIKGLIHALKQHKNLSKTFKSGKLTNKNYVIYSTDRGNKNRILKKLYSGFLGWNKLWT